MRFSIKAPASSANLGPGFDTLGLALDVWNEVDIDTDGEPGQVVNDGPEAHLLRDHENLTLVAMNALARRMDRELPPFSLNAHTAIPVSRGMGSSAAALVMGLAGANHLLDLGLGHDELLQIAWEFEGHGDNVGAVVYGGAVMAIAGTRRVARLWSKGDLGLMAAVFIPEETGSTHIARSKLPSTIPHTDGTFNLQSTATLAIGLERRDPDLIAAGMRDRMHEPYRAQMFPHLEPMKAAAIAAGAVGACLSGAGSTVLALVAPKHAEQVRDVLAEIGGGLDIPGHAEIIAPTPEGVSITVLDAPAVTFNRGMSHT